MNVEAVRAEFPALATPEGRGAVFLDNPAGTQIAARSLDRMVRAMVAENANLGGHFAASLRAAALVDEGRRAAADLVGTDDPSEVVFGQSMTTLTFAVSRALGRRLRPGDEILLTRMDHDANVAPWLMLADDLGLEVRWLDFDPGSCELDLSRLDEVLTPRVKVAAVGYASNVTGTINDVAAIARRAREVGALTYVDAVQFAPHGVIDVRSLGCDFLVCSAYKFYGPHQAVLWGRRDLLDSLPAYRVRPAPDRAPGNLETGTKSREAIAGVLGAVEHLAWLGGRFGGPGTGPTRRERVVAGLRALEEHERGLTRRLLRGLRDRPGLRVWGVTDEDAPAARRVPTVSFTVDGVDPADVARSMAEAGISVWDGHNYGIEPVRRLGLDGRGGVVRVGLGQYNTEGEVDAFLERLEATLRRR